jgi:hypothetical protein
VVVCALPEDAIVKVQRQIRRRERDVGFACRINPFYVQGDFNGDGGQDVAVWVTERASGKPGIAIVHSTVERLHVFGAGRPLPDGSDTALTADGWHVRARGSVEAHPWGDVREIGVREGVPFTFQRDTLEFVHFGKSAFAIYWANGRDWMFWTAD